MSRPSGFSVVGGAFVALLILAVAGVGARQGGESVAIDNNDIGGVVTSAKGAEAGVWVIAQTSDLPTKFIRIVVTDDRGRYLLPDLPKATYDLWVRGYGLVDSPIVKSAPGKQLNLTAVVAPNTRAAAQYYPANYWLSLLELPPASEFPGRGTKGDHANGIPEALKTQGAWIGYLKMANGCTMCHQIGSAVTRSISSDLRSKLKTSKNAWDYRVQTGVMGAFMSSALAPLGRSRALDVLASWSDRIESGELPPAPPRPRGVERNVVVTQWEWVKPEMLVHDEITTDRRNPTLNGYGPVYGVTELSGDFITVLDPIKHTDRMIPIPPHAPNLKYAWVQEIATPSTFWGNELIWKGRLTPHNPMFDGKGRVWITARHGCRMYDPKTEKVTYIPECKGDHHLQIDDHDVLWFDGGGSNSFDIKKWEAGDATGAMTMYPVVLDTNGNGKLDAGYVDATSAMDPTKDKAMRFGQSYATIPSPMDGSVWTSYSNVPGGMARLDPRTGLYEYYEVPYMEQGAKVNGFGPHGIDVDRSTGVIWMALSSGHFAAFDRRKCKGPLNGPQGVSGRLCPEGWMLHRMPGPNFKGAAQEGTSDSYLLNWVDWHNTSGFGNNTPIATGSGSDSLIAYVKGEFVTLRVPYPLGFHARGLDGRIDDPKAGWKGRGLWSTHAAHATWHQEGGKGERPKLLQFQLRPDPLAK